jgi:phosphoribosylamine---glycine ligase
MAAEGYPGPPRKGTEIGGVETAEATGAIVFHAGTRRDGDGRLLADGGRVLGVTAVGESVTEAQARAYAAVDRLDWPGGFCRRDIGWRAVERENN